MPQTAAAKKALRVSARRREANDRWRRKLRTSLKEMRLAIAAGSASKAQDVYVATQKILDRAARRHIVAPQMAARKKSRLQRAIARLA